MHSLCAEQEKKMEEVFIDITVLYLANLAAKCGKDKILQVCNYEQVASYIVRPNVNCVTMLLFL